PMAARTCPPRSGSSRAWSDSRPLCARRDGSYCSAAISTSRARSATSMPSSGSRTRLGLRRWSGRCSQRSSRTALSTVHGSSRRMTTGVSPGGRPGETSRRAISAGASITFSPARRSRRRPRLLRATGSSAPATTAPYRSFSICHHRRTRPPRSRCPPPPRLQRARSRSSSAGSRTTAARGPRAAPFDLHGRNSSVLSVFWRKTYDRTKTLDSAEKARSRGRVKKAIRGYLTVLEHEPADHVVRSKVAPLLARVGRWDEARKNFDQAADGYLKVGFAPKAIAVWTVAAQTFPEQVQYWERIASEQVKRGKRQDAVLALLEGRSMLPKKRQRPLAVMLL